MQARRGFFVPSGNGALEGSVDQNTGKIRVHHFWIAIDPGLVIQPDHVHGQLDARSSMLSVKGGAVQQSNFNDYQVLRMSDMPEIHTKIVTTGQSAHRHGRNRRGHSRTSDRQCDLPA